MDWHRRTGQTRVFLTGPVFRAAELSAKRADDGAELFVNLRSTRGLQHTDCTLAKRSTKLAPGTDRRGLVAVSPRMSWHSSSTIGLRHTPAGWPHHLKLTWANPLDHQLAVRQFLARNHASLSCCMGELGGIVGVSPRACSTPRTPQGSMAQMGAASARGHRWLQGLLTTNKNISKSIEELDFHQC